MAYQYWKAAFGKEWPKLIAPGLPPSDKVTDDAILAKLAEAATKLKADFGRFDVAYGDVYRVGRRGGKENWPVSGGSVAHIATPRAISFDPIEGKKQFLGHGGQTSPQVVLLDQTAPVVDRAAFGRKRSGG